MNCQRHRLQIIDRLGGVPDAGSESELQAHLDACPSCSRFEAEHRRLDAVLAAAALEREPSPRIWAAIERRLAQPPRPFWEAAAAWLREVASVPALRHAAVGLALMLFLSLGLVNLPRERGSEFLAQLESYQLDAGAQNPFLKQDPAWNPFFSVEVAQGENIFEKSRNQR